MLVSLVPDNSLERLIHLHKSLSRLLSKEWKTLKYGKFQCHSLLEWRKRSKFIATVIGWLSQRVFTKAIYNSYISWELFSTVLHVQEIEIFKSWVSEISHRLHFAHMVKRKCYIRHTRMFEFFADKTIKGNKYWSFQSLPGHKDNMVGLPWSTRTIRRRVTTGWYG